MRVRPWLILSAGARLDRYPTFGARTTPRAAAVLLPRQQTSIKMLYARAFRAPNPYELNYYASMRDGSFTLGPETVQSTELVWEEYFSSRVRTAVTAFRYDAENIIEQRSLVGGDGIDDLYFLNSGGVLGKGIEAEIETKLPAGFSARFSQTYAQAEDHLTGAQYSNSPRHLSKVGVQIPIRSLYLGVEGQYVGARLTLQGEPVDGFFLPNITLTSPFGRRLDLSLSVYNAFNAAYSDPAAEEHVQRTIPQDRRTFLAKVRVGF
jgi:outer membrane receptor protein involved in Fe transport